MKYGFISVDLKSKLYSMSLFTVENLGWLMTLAILILTGKGIYGKIIGSQEAVGNFAYMKLSNYRLLVGLSELVGLILLVIPATAIYGAIIMGSIMSAAVVIHLSLFGGAKTYFPILIGVLGYLSVILRHLI